MSVSIWQGVSLYGIFSVISSLNGIHISKPWYVVAAVPVITIVLYMGYYIYIEKVKVPILKRLISWVMIIGSININISLLLYITLIIVGLGSYEKLSINSVKMDIVTKEEERNFNELCTVLSEFGKSNKDKFETIDSIKSKENFKENLKKNEKLINDSRAKRDKVLMIMSTKKIGISEEFMKNSKGLIDTSFNSNDYKWFLKEEAADIQWELNCGSYDKAVIRYTNLIKAFENLADAKNMGIIYANLWLYGCDILKSIYSENYTSIHLKDMKKASGYINGIESKYMNVLKSSINTDYITRLNSINNNNIKWPYLDKNKTQNILYKIYQLEWDLPSANPSERNDIGAKISKIYGANNDKINLLVENRIGKGVLSQAEDNYRKYNNFIQGKTSINAMTYVFSLGKTPKMPINETTGEPLMVKIGDTYDEIISKEIGLLKISKENSFEYKKAATLEEINSIGNKNELKSDAKGKSKVVVFTADSNEILVDDVSKKIGYPPIIKDSKMFVPLKTLLEEMGGLTEWLDKERKVIIKLDGKTVSLIIGSKRITVDDKTIFLENPPIVQNSVIFIPLRAVSEGFGYAVGWENSTKRATILKEKANKISSEFKI